MGREKIQTGIVGCGDFARLVHAPHLVKDGRFEICAACDIAQDKARRLADEFSVPKVLTDAEEFLADDALDLVIIATRHDSHAELAIRAAEAGKHILCEKPMGITLEACRRVADTVAANGVRYTLGTNRSHAPLFVKARELVAQTHRPCVISHRMQVSYQDEWHWLLDPAVGGGKLVGEGVHLFDSVCRLAGSRPVRVSGSGGVFTRNAGLTAPDSAAITLKFANGSVASVVTASVGNRNMPKEQLEIYSADLAIQTDTFRKMTIYQGDSREVIELPEPDRGHATLIRALGDALLQDGPTPNNIHEALLASVCSFKALDAVRTGVAAHIQPDELAIPQCVAERLRS